MIARITGSGFDAANATYPNVCDGVEGVYFVQQCLASHRENGAWKPLRHKAARG